MKSVLLNGINLVCIVAKHCSLTSAARELNLTTGAVSQQLQAVEERLGFSVFERHARGIRLTEKGDKLVLSVTPHLAAIEDNVYKLMHVTDSKQIRLKLTPSLAFKWLVPRLDDFQKRHPEIQIHTFAEGALVDSESRDFDIAIDYGPLPYKLPQAELLMEESLLPVMSPGYFHHFSHLCATSSSEDWQQVTLLHDAMLGAIPRKIRSGNTGPHSTVLTSTLIRGTSLIAPTWRCLRRKRGWELRWREWLFWEMSLIKKG